LLYGSGYIPEAEGQCELLHLADEALDVLIDAPISHGRGKEVFLGLLGGHGDVSG
jgi:hypothetical protein